MFLPVAHRASVEKAEEGEDHLCVSEVHTRWAGST